MRTRLIGVFIGLFAIFALDSGAQQPAGTLNEAALRTAVQQVFGAGAGTVELERLAPGSQRITIDLPRADVPPGAGAEALTTRVIESTARLTAGERHVEYRFLVDGVPLDRLDARAAAGAVGADRVGVARRVVVSAGHGWYRHEASGTWRLQRDYYWDIVEDFVNWDIAHYLRTELIASDFDVRAARNPHRNAGTGESGRPRSEESAKYYIRDVGAPATTWNVGVDDYAKDINSRPFYANWLDAALIVSVHNNGGGGTGTETWYDTSNAFEPESRRLAEVINRRVVEAIRARYDPAWPDRGLRSCNGCHGENRLATRPAVIVEIAFMDTKNPDNDALHSDAFKQIVAQAIRLGIEEFTGPAPSGSEADAQARRDLTARAAADARFGAVVEGSFGLDAGWDPAWELRWLEFEFAGQRRVRLFHATHTSNRARFVGFWDPDTGGWRGWEAV